MKVVAKEDPPRGFVNLSCVLSAVLPFRTDVHVGLDAGFAKQGCDSAQIPLAATWRLLKFVNTPPHCVADQSALYGCTLHCTVSAMRMHIGSHDAHSSVAIRDHIREIRS